MRKRPRIVVLGSLVFDFVARAPRLPREGETLLGDMFGMFPGGKGANQAVQAGRLGAEVFMIGRVGQDFLGQRLLASLKESKVNTKFVKQDRSVNTAACCIHVDAAGHNSIVIVPEANMACRRKDVEEAAAVIRSADVLLCQLEIPLATVKFAVRLASKHGVPVILNPAPAQQLDKGLLNLLAFITPNETEAEMLTGYRIDFGTGTVRKAGEKLVARGVETAVITLGKLGALSVTKDGPRLIPSYQVDSVDTTAAGDAFNGALAVGVAEGKSLKEAILFANAAGALATTKVGAQPSLANRAEVEDLYKWANR